jgi:hypothetical protein
VYRFRDLSQLNIDSNISFGAVSGAVSGRSRTAEIYFFLQERTQAFIVRSYVCQRHRPPPFSRGGALSFLLLSSARVRFSFLASTLLLGVPPKLLSTRLPSFGDSACLSAYKSKLLERTAADMRRHKLLRLLGMDRSRVVWAREPEKETHPIS